MVPGRLALRVRLLLSVPALAIGRTNGLQVSQVVALAAIPFLVARPPGRSFWAMLLWLGPVFVSMFMHHMFADVPLPNILVNASIGLALAVLVIWPADWLADRDLFREVLAAAGAAIVLHSLIGLYQLYSFSKNQFPLLFLYVNPSFGSLQLPEGYALYNSRPFGLFPEPSAMAASLGPWTVLLAGLLLDPGLRRRLSWRRVWPVIPPVACGCLLGCRRSRPTPSIGSRWHRDARRSASPVVPVRGNRGPAAARRRGLGGQGAGVPTPLE